jgi:hypothetical protein
MLSLVFVRDKCFAGTITKQEDGQVELKAALEVRELMMPNEQGQVQRMVNFATVSPFDHEPVDISLADVYAIMNCDDTTNTQKAYDRYCEQLRQATSKIQVVPAGALPKQSNESGKIFGGQFSGRK